MTQKDKFINQIINKIKLGNKNVKNRFVINIQNYQNKKKKENLLLDFLDENIAKT